MWRGERFWEERARTWSHRGRRSELRRRTGKINLLQASKLANRLNNSLHAISTIMSGSRKEEDGLSGLSEGHSDVIQRKPEAALTLVGEVGEGAQPFSHLPSPYIALHKIANSK